jgi:hypothetical protein
MPIEIKLARNSHNISKGILVAEIVYGPIMCSATRTGNRCVFKKMILRFQRTKGKDGNVVMDILMIIISIKYAHLNQVTAEMESKITQAIQK